MTSDTSNDMSYEDYYDAAADRATALQAEVRALEAENARLRIAYASAREGRRIARHVGRFTDEQRNRERRKAHAYQTALRLTDADYARQVDLLMPILLTRIPDDA